ncbi:MAG TPA: hypothetical protein ENN69_07520 [Spirochaetia bacterium]|nr:hypothetical protein [Spirochaetia bacterium]
MLFVLRPPEWGSLIIMLLFLIPIALIDLKRHMIPNLLVFPGTAVLLLYKALTDLPSVPVALFHGALAFSIIFVFWLAARRKIGLGDAKLSFFLAAGAGFLEWWGMLLAASLSALLAAGVLIALGKMKRADQIPLAPFFFLGLVIVTVLKVVFINDIMILL